MNVYVDFRIKESIKRSRTDVDLIKMLWNKIYIRETPPYSFGNFRNLSLYNCFMPIY